MIGGGLPESNGIRKDDVTSLRSGGRRRRWFGRHVVRAGRRRDERLHGAGLGALERVYACQCDVFLPVYPAIECGALEGETERHLMLPEIRGGGSNDKLTAMRSGSGNIEGMAASAAGQPWPQPGVFVVADPVGPSGP